MANPRIDAAWVDRTLWRAGHLADKVSAEHLAEFLAKHPPPVSVQWLHDYFGDVHEVFGRLIPARTDYPQCQSCDRELDSERAKYCSHQCRQRAYRKRLTAAQRTDP